VVRFKIYDAGYEGSAAALRDASGQLNVKLCGSSARPIHRGDPQGHRDAPVHLTTTVQAHLTHVYTKLGVSSRVQLVHEAVRHA
jgi:hypothetical protein